MPLWLAHRGASAQAPENTMAAFRLARELGAHGYEFDVQRCASGELVLFHDWNFKRTTNLQDETRGVKDLSFDQLRQLDVGSWKNQRYSGEKMASLEEFFRFVNSTEFLDLEVKVKGLVFGEFARELLRLIQKYKLTNIVVSSFNPWFLRSFRALTHDIPIGLISEEKPPLLRHRRTWIRLLSPQYLFIQYHEGLAQETAFAKSRGMKVMVWTVDDLNHVAAALDCGVDGIISNRSDLLGEMPEALRRRFA